MIEAKATGSRVRLPRAASVRTPTKYPKDERRRYER
jgi:hypothetical protein